MVMNVQVTYSPYINKVLGHYTSTVIVIRVTTVIGIRLLPRCDEENEITEVDVCMHSALCD